MDDGNVDHPTDNPHLADEKCCQGPQYVGCLCGDEKLIVCVLSSHLSVEILG